VSTESLESEVTSFLYKIIPATIISLLINSLIITIVLWRVISHKILLPWLCLIFMFVIFRSISFLLYKKWPLIIKTRTWSYLFIGLTVLVGVIFGAAGVFPFPKEQFEYQVFVYFALGGMTAGSLGSFSINKKAFFAYSIPGFIPGTVNFFLIGDTKYLAMGVMGILFYIIMIITLFRMHSLTINSMKLSKENINLAASLKEISLTDSMTGLRNRRFFNDVLKPETNNLISQSLPYSPTKNRRKNVQNPIYGIFMVDIDHFKNVNDTFGHNSGDMVLKKFSNILIEIVRFDDIVIRWGGEEFLVILRRTNKNFLYLFSERLRKKVESTKFVLENGEQITKTCSIGFVPFPFSSEFPREFNCEQAITIADHALYYAKNHGRNMAVGVSIKENIKIDETVAKTIINSFDKAISENYIELHYTN